jgi:hypothetical protein
LVRAYHCTIVLDYMQCWVNAISPGIWPNNVWGPNSIYMKLRKLVTHV